MIRFDQMSFYVPKVITTKLETRAVKKKITFSFSGNYIIIILFIFLSTYPSPLLANH